jgi:hypothetical protein
VYTQYPNYVLRQSDLASIPMDERNSDCADFLAWVAAGNTPDAPPVPSIPELILKAKAETRIQRQPIIDVLDGLQVSSLALGQTARAQVIETAKQGLRDITDTDLSTCLTYEDMRLKVKAAYIALAAALPVDVRKAFADALT